MAYAFRIYDDMVLLALLAVLNDVIYDVLLVIIVFFRKQYILRAVSHAAPQRYITCAAAHNLYNGAALMR